MTAAEESVSRFDGAVMVLPDNLRKLARTLTKADRAAAEELRLRVGQPMSAVLPEGELSLGGERVTRRDIELLVEIATGASVHTAAGMIKNGYIACPGGHRVGLCGSVIMINGEMSGYSAYSSASLRIARERRGIAGELLPGLCRGGIFRSTLIAAPPGAGKTTLLRELTRLLATPEPGRPGRRVSLCDERGELAAMYEGRPQLDVGPMTDVLDGCPKARAVMTVLRAMNPEIIALDEITAPEDVAAIALAANCGTALLATAHAGSVEELRRRPMYAGLLRERIFENIVLIRRSGSQRRYEVRGGDALC